MALLSMHPYLLFLPFSFLGMGWMGPLLGGLKRWILRFPWVDFPPCKTRVSSFLHCDRLVGGCSCLSSAFLFRMGERP